MSALTDKTFVISGGVSGIGAATARIAHGRGANLVLTDLNEGAGAAIVEELGQRVLFLRHDRIGDMILTTGILRTIASSHPTIRLDVLASPSNAPVIRHEPYLNDIVVFDRHAPAGYPAAFSELRRRKYDAVIDCMVTAPSFTTLLLMLASGAGYRIGVAARGHE